MSDAIVLRLSREDKEFGDLVEATAKESPDPADIERLRVYLVRRPELSAELGDLMRLAKNTIIRKGSAIAAQRVSVEQYCITLSNELGYENATRLEQLLIDHIVLCWLRFHALEISYSAAQEKGLPIEQLEFWERKLSAGQRRYLRACETLSRVRKLPHTPSIQQVNVATSGSLQVNIGHNPV